MIVGACFISFFAAETSPLPTARGPAGRGATPQAGFPPAPPNVEIKIRCLPTGPIPGTVEPSAEDTPSGAPVQTQP